MANAVNRIILHSNTTCLTWLSILSQQNNQLCPISSYPTVCFWKTRLSVFTLRKIALTCSHNRKHSKGFCLSFFLRYTAWNEWSSLVILTSWEPGLLFPLVTEDAVCDLKWCHSLQGCQNILGGPVWKSQVMDPLHQKIAFITRHHANNHITQ